MSRVAVLQFPAMKVRSLPFLAARSLLLFFFVAPMSAPMADAQKAVEITAEPSHHLAFENQYVRVFQVSVAPHRATLMHVHHHDYVYVTIGDAHISNEVEGKAPVDARLADGDTRFVPGNFAHVARNLGDQPFRNVTIELMQDEKLRATSSHGPEESSETKFDWGSRKILFVKDGVRVSEINIASGEVVPSHHHDGPHLMVAISDVDLRSELAQHGPIPERLKTGEMKWLAANLTHAVTNVGKTPARFVTVEFAE
jgi:quercetin dioxygenase-like cupin family protein